MNQPSFKRPESVAVFCGSRGGTKDVFIESAVALGRGLADAGIRLVYGGGQIGIMGAVAGAVLSNGGQVIGVIPEFLIQREVANTHLHEMIITTSMHSRKQRMFELSDAFIMMPGGLGTLDEMFEIITWRQLGLHDRPILICDVAGSSKPVVNAIELVIETGFAEVLARNLYEVLDGPAAVLDRLTRLPVGIDAGDSMRL